MSPVNTQVAMESSGKQQMHIVLVHGGCHGAWCWFKLKPLLQAAGHRVTAVDLAASGIDPTRLEDLRGIEDYTQPLLNLLAAVPPPEKVLLVGHSFGGINLGVAMEKYPKKIAAAVFVAAFMPDSEHKPSYALEQHFERTPPEDWLDTDFSPFGPPEAPRTSMFFGPKFLSDKLYTACSPEDVELGLALVRRSSLFLEDLSKKKPFSKEGFGSVRRAYVICGGDNGIPVSFQRWQVETVGVDEVVEIAETDHMPMLCTPQLLCQILTQIADKYA